MPSVTGIATLKPRSSHSVCSKGPEEISLRRLKKRETDRRCQREARERTKSRIAYLEGLVDDLRHREATATQKLRETEAENDRMARTLDVLRAALGTQGLFKFHDQASPEPIPFRATTFPEETDCWIQPGMVSKNDVSQPTNSQSVPTEKASIFANTCHEADVNPLRERCHDQDSTSFFAEHSQIESFSSIETIGQSQSLNDEDSGQISCSCDTHINRQSGQPSIWQGNFWRFACEVLEERFEWPEALQPANDVDSDDVPIRALLEGWDVVRQENLHPSWMILSRIDEFLFPSIPKPERLAMLKAMHLLLQFNLQPSLERFMRLPSWYIYRPSQGLPHTFAIDFFAWPGFRERFVFNQHAYCGNDFWYLYQNNMRLLWPYDFADCFTRDARTGLFKTTPLFDDRVGDINCWTMRPDFFMRFPELLSEIPVSNSIPQPLSLGPVRRAPSLPPAPALSVSAEIAGVPERDKQGNTLSCAESELASNLFLWPQAQQMDNLEFMNWHSIPSG